MSANHKFQDSVRSAIPSVVVVTAVIFWTLCRVYEAGRRAGTRDAY